MAEKTCSDCTHFDVCEKRFSWLDQEDNKKYITCHHFKDKADVSEVVWCKDCKYATAIKHYGFICQNGKTPWFNDEFEIYMDLNDFCSYGERKEE